MESSERRAGKARARSSVGSRAVEEAEQVLIPADEVPHTGGDDDDVDVSWSSSQSILGPHGGEDVSRGHHIAS